MTRRNTNQKGAVSIFMVVFSALFVSIITVGFVGVMLKGAQQASSADLSNSAYDSAMAGVEDAKRLLLKYRQCLRDPTAFSDCTSVINLFNTPKCNMVRRSITGSLATDNTEMPIQSSTGTTDTNSKPLDQAYTCVIVTYLADEKKLELNDGDSALLPIDSKGAPYDTLSVSWFTKDLDANPPLSLSLPLGNPTSLPTKTAWNSGGPGTTTPPILRTQWIQHSDAFDVAGFDTDQVQSFQTVANTSTLFLYPNQVGTTTTSFTTDNRAATSPPIKQSTAILCNAGVYNFGGYVCSVDIALPPPVDNTGARTGYLQLGALYNNTKVRVALKNGVDLVKIVAPGIDSTGRANNSFRRVKAGVSFSGEYPRAGFDINGNFCKDFSVTDSSVDFDQGACNPNSP